MSAQTQTILMYISVSLVAIHLLVSLLRLTTMYWQYEKATDSLGKLKRYTQSLDAIAKQDLIQLQHTGAYIAFTCLLALINSGILITVLLVK